MKFPSGIFGQEQKSAHIILNHHGIINYSCSQIQHLLGYDSVELLGKNSFEFLCKNSCAKARLYYQKLMTQKNTVVNSMFRVKHKTGKSVWTEMTATNLLHENNINGILITLRNVAWDKNYSDARLAEVIAEAQEQEKQVFAAELHDNVKQLMVASLMFLENAKINNESIELCLEKSADTLKMAIHEVRKLSHSLVNYSVEDFGLYGAVKYMLKNLCINNDTRIVFWMHPCFESKLSIKEKIHVFRIIQEQITNIIKHAAATKVLISLTQAEDQFSLRISDNGKGFNEKECNPGIGISNMIRRIKALNGHLHITSALNSGTSVSGKFKGADK